MVDPFDPRSHRKLSELKKSGAVTPNDQSDDEHPFEVNYARVKKSVQHLQGKCFVCIHIKLTVLEFCPRLGIYCTVVKCLLCKYFLDINLV